jgi:hypothetical protein
MLRMRNLLALAAAALSLTAALMAPVQANPNSNNNSGSYNNTNWCDAWSGCQYSCNIGGFKGKLVIDSAHLEGGYNSICCSWEGTFWMCDNYGNSCSYPCHGYCKRGCYFYYKVEGNKNWCCMGGISYDLRQCSGNVCDFDHCGFGNWIGQCCNNYHVQ